ncbi:hydroxyacylglutathione hydrolase [Desulfonatronum thiosulfatophilum]|uniref:Hydroxyacylglutathione hydrolase n=1 Tax=Desulfonatronum thiosulfatophilum TaxID=617002 RepID=A0A1G6CUM5_9BACT|nr:MBL fold metallo-hydrolase [Desulfonatronum thiosulfatophilum]SDB36573.1 hydroxyacylglutathione hydrolase [Desulfonatronum thiosulfatophilum]
MAIVFEQIHTPGVAQLSYLLGNPSKGIGVVIDPRPDVDIYLHLARKHEVGITHIIETHIHVDFVSGSHELRAKVPNAKIYASHEADAGEYGYDHEPVHSGDTLDFGSFILTARHTPGHTAEHLAYLMSESKHKDSIWAVFSGDSLFVNSVGRPDLVGEEETKRLAGALYESIVGFYGSLDDSVLVFPCHGSGSSCGPDIGDLKCSTIGYEQKHNRYMRTKDRDAFIQMVLESSGPEPFYYKPMHHLNARGADVQGGYPPVPALSVADFKQTAENQNNIVLDTRDMMAFCGGHIPGALNIGARAELSSWAGWMLKFDDPLLLVLENDDQLERIVKLLWRTGYVHFAGYLVGGMKSWNNAGLMLNHIPQMSVHELKDVLKNVQLVDVRTPAEWKSGHIPGARHFFVPYLRDNIEKLDREKTTVTYCGSGYRSSIAASVLKQNGFDDVRNIPGSWQAWTNAGFPVEGGKP